VKNHPLLAGVTLPKTGSTGRAGLLMVTKSLLFAGEGYSCQPFFRALDKKTGATLWAMQTPAGPPVGVSMTYFYHGKQYVVVAVEGIVTPRTAAEVVAYAMP